MKKEVRIAALGVLACAVLLGVVKFAQIMMIPAFVPPPEAVTTTKVTAELWRQSFETVGSFAAIKGATLSTQESGNVVRVGFESGAKVSEGQVLIELDRSVEEANLKGALARLELAKQNMERAAKLKSQSALSLATYQDAEAQVKQAEAAVQSTRGVIERKTILAPFAGRAGIRAVNVSQYVTAGTPLVPLYAVEPIHFNFSVPQQIAPTLRDSREPVAISVDAFPGRVFRGAVTAINPNINEVTRSVDVQATVSNEAEDLLPGMFGSVRIELGAAKEVVAVPVSSVQYAPYGNSVYVVEHKTDATLPTVRQQIVQLGPKRGDFVAVSEGLRVGEEVVTSGGFKLRPGASIAISQGGAVPASENPAVKDT